MPSSGSPWSRYYGRGGSPRSCVALRSLCAGDSPLWPGLSQDRDKAPRSPDPGVSKPESQPGRGAGGGRRFVMESGRLLGGGGEGIRYGKWPAAGEGGLLCAGANYWLLVVSIQHCCQVRRPLPTWMGPWPPRPAATDSQSSSWGPKWGRFPACHSLSHRLGPSMGTCARHP